MTSPAVDIAFPPALRARPFDEALAAMAAARGSLSGVPLSDRLNALEGLSDALLAKRAALAAKTPVAGLAFLAAFLRRTHLEELLAREFPRPECLERFVPIEPGKSLRVLPRGVVCHWIAGNVPLLGMFSWAVSALLGNVNVLRVSSRVEENLSPLLDELAAASPAGALLADQTLLAFFDRDHREAHEAMSRIADVRLAWGGEEAVQSIRSLPTSWECDDVALGPRVSLAVVDPGLAGDAQLTRLATDVVYFDQLACSSPQILFVKAPQGSDRLEAFVERFAPIFARQALAAPRHRLDFAETYQILLDRARVVAEGGELRRDEQTQWTLAIVERPLAKISCANRFLQVVGFEDFGVVERAIPRNVQTVVTLLSEEDFAGFSERAAQRGVCRFPRPGEGNHFDVPWDGIPLMSRLTRWVVRSDPRLS